MDKHEALKKKKDTIKEVLDAQKERKRKILEEHNSNSKKETHVPIQTRTQSLIVNEQPLTSGGNTELLNDMNDTIQSLLDQNDRDSKLIEQTALDDVYLSDEYKRGVEDTKSKLDAGLTHCKNTIKYLEIDLTYVCDEFKRVSNRIHVIMGSLSRGRGTILHNISVLSKQAKDLTEKIDEIQKKRV